MIEVSDRENSEIVVYLPEERVMGYGENVERVYRALTSPQVGMIHNVVTECVARLVWHRICMRRTGGVYVDRSDLDNAIRHAREQLDNIEGLLTTKQRCVK